MPRTTADHARERRVLSRTRCSAVPSLSFAWFDSSRLGALARFPSQGLHRRTRSADRRQLRLGRDDSTDGMKEIDHLGVALHGERFDDSQDLAAHRALPLPLARVLACREYVAGPYTERCAKGIEGLETRSLRSLFDRGDELNAQLGRLRQIRLSPSSLAPKCDHSTREYLPGNHATDQA